MGPLQGIRILDLSRILAGPWATQLLGDFGADVIKVEKPGTGDDTRHWGPPWRKGDDDEMAESAYYLCANRNKRSLAIDIASERGQALVCDLAARSDVLIENYKVGGLKKYGLDYASLSASLPRLVYCSITGFGQDGPYAQRAGYDAAIQAMGGLMSITGPADGEPGAGPQKVGVAVADLMTGMYAATAILAALRHRDATGQGQHIDLALLDTQVAWLANQASNWLNAGELPGRLGTAHPSIVPYQVLRTADGHLMLAVGNDAQFARFARVTGAECLASDARFATNAQRVVHRDALLGVIEPLLAAKPTSHWLAALAEQAVPASPINRIDEVFADPQVRARGLRIEQVLPTSGSVKSVRNPVRFSISQIEYRFVPPQLGADTDAVLADLLHLDAAQLETLRHDGIIG
ncbi:MAG: CoA transferase [Proteobacteria bacterium]|uniref:CaiB/BaiF CoA transferase family protein n=1 Tax=Rudaea sp. TaxID=2136325 RepID=UPI003784F2E3|nr:CoA transferase [Pseudomonadota bacterium]